MKKSKNKTKALDPLFLLHISDAHIGYAPAEQTYKEFYDEDNGIIALMHNYIEGIHTDTDGDIRINGLVIEGDFFHKILTVNSPHASLAVNIMSTFVDLFINEHQVPIFLLQGTYSHDFNQLDVFKSYEFLYPDKFHVINKVTEMTLESGHKVLFLPEQYMKNQDEFYAEFINPKKHYHIICGHGFFKHNCFNKNDVEKPMADMPIFDDDVMLDLADLIIFGHDHHHHIYKDRIAYNGSTSRLCHGEEEPKGFLATIQNLPEEYEEDYLIDFIENVLTPTFKTVLLNKITKHVDDFEQCVKAIKKHMNSVDFLKVKINQEVIKVNPTITELLKEYFVNEKTLSIDSAVMQLRNGEIIEIDSGSDESEDEEAVATSKYAFLFDQSQPQDAKIYEFINLKHGNSSLVSEIDREFIRDAILPN